ncbi:hypothetical protein [Dongia sp.]|uniref:hypothetical protein n=1 Tax=Dongia sp. TaxID=1977262 RepID=UPI0035B3B38C
MIDRVINILIGLLLSLALALGAMFLVVNFLMAAKHLVASESAVESLRMITGLLIVFCGLCVPFALLLIIRRSASREECLRVAYLMSVIGVFLTGMRVTLAAWLGGNAPSSTSSSLAARAMNLSAGLAASGFLALIGAFLLLGLPNLAIEMSVGELAASHLRAMLGFLVAVAFLCPILAFCCMIRHSSDREACLRIAWQVSLIGAPIVAGRYFWRRVSA